MLKSVFHRFVPASAYGGTTLSPVLSKLAVELDGCESSGAAADVLDRSKPLLLTHLRTRFKSPEAEGLALKILNICLAKYHFRSRSTSLLSRPFGLVIDPSNMCQLACPGCVHSERSEALNLFDWPKGTLPENRMSALLKLYGPYSVGAYFCNYGEPLLNLNTPKLIRQAKEYLIGTALSTSLSVQRFDAEAYVQSGLDFMVISIDGATQPVYERYRRNGNLELVFRNVRALVEAKRKLRKHTPVLSWNFLAFEHNAHEIPLAANRARELGMNEFRVVEPFDVAWDDPEIRLTPMKGGVKRLTWLCSHSLAENWNPFPDSVPREIMAQEFDRSWGGQASDDRAQAAGHTCHWLYKNIIMDATGRIMPCCGAPAPEKDLVFASFDGSDAFNSEKYRRARSWFKTGEASENPPYCTKCEWDHTTVNVGGPEIRRYFRAADSAFFDSRSLDFLSGW